MQLCILTFARSLTCREIALNYLAVRCQIPLVGFRIFLSDPSISTPDTDRVEAEVFQNKEAVGESHQRALCEGRSKRWDLSIVTKFWRNCHANKHALLASKIQGKYWASTCITILVIQCLSALDSVDPEERRYPRPVGAMMRFCSGVIASTPQDNRAMRIRRG